MQINNPSPNIILPNDLSQAIEKAKNNLLIVTADITRLQKFKAELEKDIQGKANKIAELNEQTKSAEASELEATNRATQAQHEAREAMNKRDAFSKEAEALIKSVDDLRFKLAKVEEFFS